MSDNKSSQEKRIHSSESIPFSYYPNIIPDYFVSVPMHWHEEFEIAYIESGRGRFICGDKKFTVSAGDIVLTPPGVLHSATRQGNEKLIFVVLVFNPVMLGFDKNDRAARQYLRPILNGDYSFSRHISIRMPYYLEIKECVTNIMNCASNNNSLSDLLLKSELIRLMWTIGKNGTPLLSSSDGKSYSELVRPSIEYMTANYQGDLTIDELAEASHLSKSYFMSCFKKAVGMTAFEFLAQLRIKAACEMLINTDASIADIAFNCGYRNLSNFNRQFLAVNKCTPKDYRKTKSASLPNVEEMQTKKSTSQ